MRVREKVIEWETADDIYLAVPALDSSTWKLYVSCGGVRTGRREKKSIVQPVLRFSASRPSRPSLPDRSIRICYCRLLLLSARLEQDETGEGDRVSKDLNGGDGRSEGKDRTRDEELCSKKVPRGNRSALTITSNFAQGRRPRLTISLSTPAKVKTNPDPTAIKKTAATFKAKAIPALVKRTKAPTRSRW